MRVHVDLAGDLDVVQWSARHARGEVPDKLPYGLDKLVPHGITPVFRQPLRHPMAVELARQVRGRLWGMDFLPVANNALRHERRTADVVLCWDETTGIPAALVPGGPPIVSGAAWLRDPAQVPRPLRVLARCALPRLAAIFYYCRSMVEVLAREWRLPESSFRVIRMGVDETYFRPLPYPEAAGTVMSVGDDRYRDHARLVRCIEGVLRRGVPARLELATTQKQVEVPEHVGVLHRRRMEGAIMPMYERSAVVAIAVKPGAGVSGLTALLEAMACARPVVITGNPGFEEYVEDGVTGLLVTPGDDLAFQDAVASLLKDPEAAAEMGRAGRRAVERNFTSAHLNADIAAVLRSVV